MPGKACCATTPVAKETSMPRPQSRHRQPDLFAPKDPPMPIAASEQRKLLPLVSALLAETLVLRVIQRIHKGIGICDTGSWLGGWGHGTTSMRGFERCGARAVGGNRSRPQPAAQTCGAGAHRLELGRRRDWPQAGEIGPCSPRQIGTRRSRWRTALASAGQWYGDGNSALPRAGWRVCCATRPASPARRRSRRKPRRGWWH
jgi:hypothetical protein